MITTRYTWEVDHRNKVLSNEYGQILRDGPAWHFRGSYFDQDWAVVLTRNPLNGCESLQRMIRNVEACIGSYRQVVRHRSAMRVVQIAAYTSFLVAISVSMLLAWAKAAGY